MATKTHNEWIDEEDELTEESSRLVADYEIASRGLSHVAVAHTYGVRGDSDRKWSFSRAIRCIPPTISDEIRHAMIIAVGKGAVKVLTNLGKMGYQEEVKDYSHAQYLVLELERLEQENYYGYYDMKAIFKDMFTEAHKKLGEAAPWCGSHVTRENLTRAARAEIDRRMPSEWTFRRN